MQVPTAAAYMKRRQPVPEIGICDSVASLPFGNAIIIYFMCTGNDMQAWEHKKVNF